MTHTRALGLLLWITLVVSTVFSTSCGVIPTTVTGGTGTSTYTFSMVYAVITSVPRCVDCHSPPSGSAVTAGSKLDFSTQALAYSTLTTKKLEGGTSGTACNSVSIVDSAGRVTMSGLAAVLFSDYNTTNDFAGATGCKPYTGHHSDLSLSSSEKSTILGWISDGAKNNLEFEIE